MTTIKINEQIAFLRKQKGLTQEELANALGVTNQSVSKWESAQCCPDIQLLPDIAELFDVSVDELIGYKATDGLGDICLRIKDYFLALPERAAFEDAYRIAALMHEARITAYSSPLARDTFPRTALNCETLCSHWINFRI